MKNNVSTLFYLKKPKNYSSGPAPIYMRITVDGTRTDLLQVKAVILRAGMLKPTE